VLLTEARVRAGRLCRTSASKSCGGAQAEVGDEIDAGVLRAPELHGSTCGVPAKPMEGSAWLERHRQRPIATTASSPETASRPDSDVRKEEGRGQRARSRSWARDGAYEAALVGRSAAGRPVHSGVGHGAAEQAEEVALGLGRRPRGGGMRVQGLGFYL
jgi:hypothetical protein